MAMTTDERTLSLSLYLSLSTYLYIYLSKSRYHRPLLHTSRGMYRKDLEFYLNPVPIPLVDTIYHNVLSKVIKNEFMVLVCKLQKLSCLIYSQYYSCCDNINCIM